MNESPELPAKDIRGGGDGSGSEGMEGAAEGKINS